ncbi:hypothetical protein [Vallitalea guaymasensis]|uniref:hypothetical protein n=1 Tax=Vallitalea guaymasensis TaxID=1185412 RepID=UPI0023530F34|nr:hypothetical protein [Vallitalea guaymasensis]
MKKRTIKLFSIVTIFALLLSTNILAARDTIYLQSSQKWKSTSAVSRTGQYTYGYAKCYSVYPSSGKDTFKKIQTHIKSGSTEISDTYTLNEGSSKTSVVIKEGYLDKKSIVFEFRGNHPDYSAYADVEYFGN